MTDYALNLDAPVDSDPTPDPLDPLADYLEPHERDLALMVAFAHFILTEGSWVPCAERTTRCGWRLSWRCGRLSVCSRATVAFWMSAGVHK